MSALSPLHPNELTLIAVAARSARSPASLPVFRMLFFAVVWEIGAPFYIPLGRPHSLTDFVAISGGLLKRQLLHRPHLWLGRAVPSSTLSRAEEPVGDGRQRKSQ
jgi:hypothetical protein